jgi:hypothetical protein
MRHNDRDPSKQRVEEARVTVAKYLTGNHTDDDVRWEIPPLTALETATYYDGTPIAVSNDSGANVLLRSFTRTNGNPQHGALMSGAHVSGLEATIPLECGACGHDRARLDYSRHHNIAGSYGLTCERCEETIDSETWG